MVVIVRNLVGHHTVVDGNGSITRYGRYRVTSTIYIMVYAEEVVVEVEYISVVSLQSCQLGRCLSILSCCHHSESRLLVDSNVGERLHVAVKSRRSVPEE